MQVINNDDYRGQRKTNFALDSKQLTEERRSSIFADYEKHRDYLGFILKVLSPHMISTCMLRRYVRIWNRLPFISGFLRSLGINII